MQMQLPYYLKKLSCNCTILLVQSFFLKFGGISITWELMRLICSCCVGSTKPCLRSVNTLAAKRPFPLIRKLLSEARKNLRKPTNTFPLSAKWGYNLKALLDILMNLLYCVTPLHPIIQSGRKILIPHPKTHINGVCHP